MDPTLKQAEKAARVGLSRVNLWIRAKGLGLPPLKEGRPSVIPDEELKVLWAADVLVADIARLYGCQITSVRPSARRLNLPRPPNLPHRTVPLAEYRQQLLRRANDPTRRLSDVERAILERTRPT